jgi:hypothetical protein
LEEREEGLGIDLLAKFDEKLTLALESPKAGKLEGTTAEGLEVRSYRLARFKKYFIFVVVQDAVMTVIAFKHGSRHPDYWRHRTVK